MVLNIDIIRQVLTFGVNFGQEGEELMMMIKKLSREDYIKAAELKVYSFDEEVQGTVPNTLSQENQAKQMEEWVDAAHKYDDIRLLYGAFEGEDFIGFTGASIAEEEDSKNGFELNYLFVNEKYRGKGISLKLLQKLLDEFCSRGFKEMIVYNYSVSPSNNFYRKFGGKVVKESAELGGKLPIDIFSFDSDDLKNKIEKKIADKYKASSN